MSIRIFRRLILFAVCLAALGVGLLAVLPQAVASDSSAVVENESSSRTADESISDSRKCFRKHLEDAAVMNTERLPLYSKLTDGRSEVISRRLARVEKMGVFLFANKIDGAAEPYHAAGLNIICEDMVDMALVPEFRETYADGAPKAESFVDVDVSDTKARLRDLVKKRDLPALELAIESELEKLSHELRLNCMLRHTLESMLRIARLAPRHSAQAVKLGLPDTWKLSRDLLELHYPSLNISNWFDRKALPLQLEGVPILCQDVPPLL